MWKVFIQMQLKEIEHGVVDKLRLGKLGPPGGFYLSEISYSKSERLLLSEGRL